MWESKYGFGEPFIDIDEWRPSPRRHRYVHGGFEGTRTLFSFYMPPMEQYDGRFIQYLEGGAGGHEGLLAAGGYPGMGFEWIFDLAYDELGAVLVESNQGHGPNEGTGFADDVERFGASAESARYAKMLAAEMYGVAPHHGYVWGVSGGGVRSAYCIEGAPEIYDGAAPHALWSGGGIRMCWSAASYWWLTSRHRLDDVIDAMSPGGSGDPFGPLTIDEREGLATVYRAGYPRGAESQLWQFAPWLWNLAGYKEQPYYTDFWTKPGYLGHDNPAAIAHLLLERDTTVGNVIRLSELGPNSLAGRMASAGAVSAPDDQVMGIAIADDLDDNTRLFGALLTFKSGKARGRSVFATGVEGRVLTTSGEMHGELFSGVEVGDEVHVDNHVFVAWCHLHRHALDFELLTYPDPDTLGRVPVPDYAGIRAWMVDGRPLYPQVPVMESTGGPNNHTGSFIGKVIHVNMTHDSMVWPGGAHGWTRKIQDRQGSKLDEVYRIWWVDNSPHGAPEFLGPFATKEKDPGVWRSREVSYDGVSAQALRHLAKWVEEGDAPPASTVYRFTDDGAVVLPSDAKERGGVQPLAWATANGGPRAEVKAGESVVFEGRAEQPPGTGSIVWALWDFEGRGDVAERREVDGATCTITSTHTYLQPGTYFASFRVGAHRDGPKGRGPAVENLARVRVVVR